MHNKYLPEQECMQITSSHLNIQNIAVLWAEFIESSPGVVHGIKRLQLKEYRILCSKSENIFVQLNDNEVG